VIGILLLIALFSWPARATRSAPNGVVRFVNAAATGSGTGTSWANAYPDLNSALAAALNGDVIWVAAGTYRPTSGSDRTATFKMKVGVVIYGGFNGTETGGSQRDWTTNVVTLSGDLLGDDVGFANNAENSYHVVSDYVFPSMARPPAPPKPFSMAW
jgi:hypothetical protein